MKKIFLTLKLSVGNASKLLHLLEIILLRRYFDSIKITKNEILFALNVGKKSKMGLFFRYYKYGNGTCLICKEYFRKKKPMKEHVGKHYKSGFFDSEDQKRKFIAKNAHRIVIKLKTQEINFKTYARSLGVTKIPEENTNCYFCGKKDNQFICAFCLENFHDEIVKEWFIFIDGKEYDNKHVNDLIFEVMMKVKEEDEKYLANIKYIEIKKMKQTNLADLLN